MSNGQADFFRNMLPYARRVSELTGIDPRLVLAQSALETGYGRSAPNFNFFGIKAPQGQGASLLTSEFENGRMVQRNEPFRTYDSPEGSFQDYANLMLRAPRYRPVLEARTLEDQIAAMAGSGYATDPEYGRKLSQIASGINLNDPGLIASDAMTAIGRGPDVSGMTATGRARPAMNGQPTQPGLLAQGGAPERPRRDIGNILDQLAIGFSGMSLRPNQGIIQMAQQRIGQRQEQQQTQRERNATADWLESQGLGAFADGVRRGAISASDALTMSRGPEATSAQRNYEFLLAQGVPQDQALQRAFSGGTTINMPGAPTIGTIPPGYQAVQDPQTGRYTFEPIPGGPAAAEQVAAAGAQSQAAATAQDSIALIDAVLSDPNLGAVTGMLQGRMPPMTQAGTDLVTRIEQLQGQAFLQAFESLKGGGAITEREGLAAQNAIARLNRAQSKEAFQSALQELRAIMERGLNRASSGQTSSQPAGGTEINGVVVGDPY